MRRQIILKIPDQIPRKMSPENLKNFIYPKFFIISLRSSEFLEQTNEINDERGCLFDVSFQFEIKEEEKNSVKIFTGN